MKYLLMATAILLGLGLFAYQAMEESPEKMGFLVGLGDPSLMQGVHVLLVQKDGEVVDIGKTDAAGFLEIDKRLLRQKGVAVLFCREGFFCGALLVSDSDFFKNDERYIELAPLAWL